jgi:hypothetical protein
MSTWGLHASPGRSSILLFLLSTRPLEDARLCGELFSGLSTRLPLAHTRTARVYDRRAARSVRPYLV